MLKLIFHIFNIHDPMTLVPVDWNFNILSLLSHIIWISTAVSDNGSLWTNVCPMKEGKTTLWIFLDFNVIFFLGRAATLELNEWIKGHKGALVDLNGWKVGLNMCIWISPLSNQHNLCRPQIRDPSQKRFEEGQMKSGWYILKVHPSSLRLDDYWFLDEYHDYCKYTEIPFVFLYVFVFQ